MNATSKYKSVVKEIPEGLMDNYLIAHCILMGCCVIAESIRNVMDEDPVVERK